MVVCTMPGCQTSAGCKCSERAWGTVSIPSPRTMTVTLPISNFGLTVAYMDGDGNILIRTDQPTPVGVQF